MTTERRPLTYRPRPDLRERLEFFSVRTNRTLGQSLDVLLERALAVWETDPYYAPERERPGFRDGGV